MLWTTTGELVESFSNKTLKKEPFKYSFTYTFYTNNSDDTKDTVWRKGSIYEREAPGSTHIIQSLSVTHSSEINLPMKLYINDLTTYVLGQPLLALIIVLNEEKVRLPVQFKTEMSSTPNNRQVRMPLPPFSTVSFEFDFNTMRLA